MPASPLVPGNHPQNTADKSEPCCLVNPAIFNNSEKFT